MHFADLLKTIAANHAEPLDRKAGTPGAGARKSARPPKERGNEEPQTTNDRTGEDGSAASAAFDAAPLLPTQADSGIVAIEREQTAEGSGRPGATIHRMDAEAATLQGDFLHLYSSVTDSVVSGVTVAANPFDRAASTSDLVISGSSGADTILTGSGDDIVRASGGADAVNTGAGNDIIVIVGQTASGQYAQSDITNPGGSGIDLSGVIALDNLNGRTVSEVLAGETLDGGAGANRLVIYGNVDLTGVTLTNITQLQVNSTVTISAQQINALGLTLLSGDGGSVLNITNDGAAPVTLNLSGVSFSDFRTLNIGGGVTVVADQAGVDSLQYLTGEGVIKASSGSGTLNLSGKYITLAVQDKDGNNDATHGGGNFVAGKLLIGTESADTLTGGNAADRIEGGAGNDILVGGNGNDVLRGGAGVDSMDGGAGDDTFVIVGDLSGGGKVDSDADTTALGFKLTTLNGQNLNEDEDGAAEIIRGGDGDDTLYVYGTADLTNYDLTGIEHVEIRSDVKFSDGQISGFKSIAGDGSSIVRIEATGSAPIVVDLADLASRTGLTLSNIGQISVGANVTVKIDSLDRLGGARILTGEGSIEAKTGTVYLTGYTKTAALAVKNANGTAASGAEVLEHVITKPAGSNIITGTSGDDYLIGTDNAETLDSKSGNDYLSGKDGNDTFKISGSGIKIILDGTGTDTLDLSAVASAAGTAEAPFTLTDGGRAGAATVQLGSGSVATGKKPLDVFIAEDLSGSFGDDVSTVRTLLDNLITSIRRDVQPNTAFGAGSFVDKPASTFGQWPDYVYRTDSAISTDTGKVKTAFDNMRVLWGYDEPESQLEALYQVALRADKPVVSGNMDTTGIGFRSDAARVVILATDANYHRAGDWAGAGANDGDTILDGSPPGSGEDYPSVAQVKTALQNANIFPIFAVTNWNNAKSAYEGLVTQLGRGKVVDLASNSADIVNAIKTGLASYKQDFIENVIGTKYDDVLVGNGLGNEINGGGGNDTLIGGAGNDKLVGGDGEDTAAYSWNKAGYSVAKNATGDWSVTDTDIGNGDDGVDILVGVENIQFADTTREVLSIAGTRSAEDIFNDAGGGFAGKVRIMADFAKAAYSLGWWETKSDSVFDNRFINDVSDAGIVSADSVLADIKQHWQPVPLSVNFTEDVSYLKQEVQYGTGIAALSVSTNWTSANSNQSGKVYDGSYFTNDNAYASIMNHFESGIYSNRNSAALIMKSSDAVVIAFRGTNDNRDNTADAGKVNPYDVYAGSANSGVSDAVAEGNSAYRPDVGDWNDKSSHYNGFHDLFVAVENYLTLNSGIKNIFVTGHSLGGAMVEAFMSNHRGNDHTYEAITFAAPPYYTTHSDDSRVTSIEIESDPVPTLPGDNIGKVVTFVGNGTAYDSALSGVGLDGDANTHSMDYYRDIAVSVDANTWEYIHGNSFSDGDAILLGAKRTVDGRKESFNVDSGGDVLSVDVVASAYHGVANSESTSNVNINVVFGGIGNDKIYIGDGASILVGGTGSDEFQFWDLATNYKITDFSSDDIINLSQIDADSSGFFGWLNDKFSYKSLQDAPLTTDDNMPSVLTYSETYHELWGYTNRDTDADLKIKLPDSITATDISMLISNGHIVL